MFGGQYSSPLVDFHERAGTKRYEATDDWHHVIPSFPTNLLNGFVTQIR